MQFRRGSTAHSRERPALARQSTRQSASQPARRTARIIVQDRCRQRKIEDISFRSDILQSRVPVRGSARESGYLYQPFDAVAGFLVLVAYRHRVFQLEGYGEPTHMQPASAYV